MKKLAAVLLTAMAAAVAPVVIAPQAQATNRTMAAAANASGVRASRSRSRTAKSSRRRFTQGSTRPDKIAPAAEVPAAGERASASASISLRPGMEATAARAGPDRPAHRTVSGRRPFRSFSAATPRCSRRSAVSAGRTYHAAGRPPGQGGCDKLPAGLDAGESHRYLRASCWIGCSSQGLDAVRRTGRDSAVVAFRN